MLGAGNGLIFPRLRFVANHHIIQDDEQRRASKRVKIFQLDWQQFDEWLRNKHNQWLSTYHEGKDIPFISGLPSNYDDLVYGCRFALSDYYFDEIRRCANHAAYEWKTQRRFDTIIRDLCLKPAIAYVMVAFELLADCIYDPDTKNFSRRVDHRVITASAMAHKFWMHQTGGACVTHNAGIPALQRRLDYTGDAEVRTTIEQFLSALETHAETRREAYESAFPPS